MEANCFENAEPEAADRRDPMQKFSLEKGDPRDKLAPDEISPWKCDPG
jgi:hypothetical protein